MLEHKEHKDWAAFDVDTLDATSDSELGGNDIAKLMEKFQVPLGEKGEVAEMHIFQKYNNFQFRFEERITSIPFQ